MSKVDMSRYIECPVCHTYQITLSPCQKCVARKMAAEGRLPASGIVPYDPFKVYSLEQKAKEKPPKQPKKTPPGIERSHASDSYQKKRTPQG